jgi:hypothetical protein
MKSLQDITNADLIKISELLGGATHLSAEAQISQAKELFTTNRLYNQQTNIPGIRWYRAFKYLEQQGYDIS